MSYEIDLKPTFLNQLLALPQREVAQVMEKVRLLQNSPQPDSKNKKRLQGYKNPVFRIRSGDYRILYAFGDGWVALLGVDHRKDVYEGDELVAEAPRVDLAAIPKAEELLVLKQTTGMGADRDRRPAPAADGMLPIAVDVRLLSQLRIPDAYIPALAACVSVEDLLVVDVPDTIRERVFDVITSPDYESVFQQPSFIAEEPEDLLRFVKGELLGFLLKLDPDQEKYATWALRGAGPTLVKGGPGTGKSTVALYRARTLIDVLRKDGTDQPRILFTTYTNALVAFSQQLLARLLGENAALVDVRTADSLVMEIVTAVDGRCHIADGPAQREAIEEAIATAQFDGNALQRRVQSKTIDRLDPNYLLEELNGVIEGRALPSMEAYLTTSRSGRRLPLNATQREAVWRVHEAFGRALSRRGLWTWEGLRRRAAEVVAGRRGPEPYDGAIIDEAQDLPPTVLRLLLGLCKTPDRLFVTADANQSIYGAGFRWTDVHADLRFTGRTGVLRTNHRTTRDIGEAARAYLQGAALEAGDDVPAYGQDGAAPVVRVAPTPSHETQLLVQFIGEATRAYRLGIGACAVLAPTERVGKAIANRLTNAGIAATYMTGRDLDLEQRVTKVITLKSAKGLEFPIVALAGFGDGPYPGLPKSGGPEEMAEALERERRTLYVAMTRAMRALLVALPESPAGPDAPLFVGFGSEYWNSGQASSTTA